jgi:hypothetical protein
LAAAAVAACLTLAVDAFAADSAPPEEESLPIPTLTIDRIPPDASWEIGVSLSYGVVPYYDDQVPPWVGFGIRGGWGPNFGNHRIGPALALTSEGPLGIHTSIVTEPSFGWDHVSQKQMQIGASAGFAVSYNSRADIVLGDRGVSGLPAFAARFGWSQTWTRVGRRLHAYVEPKLRLDLADLHKRKDGILQPMVSINVGSGQGY